MTVLTYYSLLDAEFDSISRLLIEQQLPVIFQHVTGVINMAAFSHRFNLSYEILVIAAFVSCDDFGGGDGTGEIQFQIFVLLRFCFGMQDVPRYLGLVLRYLGLVLRFLSFRVLRFLSFLVLRFLSFLVLRFLSFLVLRFLSTLGLRYPSFLILRFSQVFRGFPRYLGLLR